MVKVKWDYDMGAGW